MAENTPPQKPATETKIVQQPDPALLGKPAEGWKTFVTKTAAVLTAISAVSSVAWGAVALVAGRRVEPGALKSFANIGGGVAIAAGVVEGVAAKAMWDSADSASRTRNYLKLSEQLNAKETSVSR